MAGYWIRHRLFYTVIMSVAIALIASILFVYPYILQQATYYNSQSIYKNTEIDFIAPEPSLDQADSLPGTHGIEKVFPFFLTKTQVDINGVSRTTTVLLSDQLQNIDTTMYNGNRLIEKANEEYENPVLVDWQFCHDTSASIGDTLSFTINGGKTEYKVYAIYETNSIYDGGAILAKITEGQREAIMNQSSNNGYSGVFIVASDYDASKSYLTTDYRPLGRLKNRDQFNDDKQYQIHYNAIMSSNYANEITDFRVKEDSLEKKSSSLMIWLGAILSAIIILVYNIVMSKRGCENVYFAKYCLPRGKAFKSYYSISFLVEVILTVALFAMMMILRIKHSDEFIPKTVIGIKIILVPIAVVIAEIISLFMNYSMVSGITREYEFKMKKAEEQTPFNDEEK